MKALNIWIAENIFNFTWGPGTGWVFKDEKYIDLPDFCVDKSFAFKIVEILNKKFWFVMNTNAAGNYDVNFQSKDTGEIYLISNQENLALAICLAAKKAKERA